MKRKIIALLLLVVLVVSVFSGCGGTTNDPSSATEPKTTTEDTVKPEETSEPASSEEPEETQQSVKISYCSWMTKGEDKFVNDQFMEENPNIEVETISLDGSQYDTLLRTKVLAGDAPDVFIVTSGQREAFVKDNFLMDVTDIPAVDELLPMVPGLAELAQEDGKLYGFPMNPKMDINPVYYNKNYFEEKGFDEPNTMEEFEKLLESIKADGKEPIVLGGKDAWTSNFFAQPWSKAFNLPRYDGIDADRKLLNGDIHMSDYYRETYEIWQSYVEKGFVSPASVSLTYDQSVQYFADGKAALLAQGSWTASDENVLDSPGMELAAFIMPVPQEDGKRYIGAQADMFLAVSADTQHAEAALALLNHWTTPEVLREYGDSTGTPTLYPIGYDISPILEPIEASKLADDVVLDFSGQLSRIPQGVYDETQTSMVNIVAGATAEEELERLDSLFEKSKSNMTVD